MARIPFIEEDNHPELSELITRIKSGRRGNLLNVYKLLLHSPALAERWMELIDSLRRETELDGRSKEIAIVRVAHVNRSEYELKQHVPRIAIAQGLTLDEVAAIRQWPETIALDERDAAVVAYADAVTRHVGVTDQIFKKLIPHFSARQIVELTITIGIYNMHGRFIEPLGIDLEPDLS